MQAPKEDKDAMRARKRERRASMMERRDAAEDQAYGLTNDLRSVYGMAPGANTIGDGPAPVNAPVLPGIARLKKRNGALRGNA